MTENTNDKKKMLTAADVEELISDPSDKKIDITQKIADYYKNGGFDSSQIEIAKDIFRLLVKDTEDEVRKTLSEAIKDADVPNDIVVTLAQDIDIISLPVLQFSKVLTDADLIEIVKSTEDAQKQIAITKRDDVSESVSEALVETQKDEVVDSLLKNEKAEVSEESYSKIIEDFSSKEEVMESLLERGSLSVSVVERLTEAVSDAMLKGLSERHQGVFEKIDVDVVRKSRDMATMKVIGGRSHHQEYYQFHKMMERLHIAEDLAPIAALCVGNMHIFQVSIARATQVTVLNVRTLLDDGSKLGFKAIYERAKLPMRLYTAVELLYSVLETMKDDIEKELEEGCVFVGESTANRILQALAQKVQERGEPEGLDFITSLISHKHK